MKARKRFGQNFLTDTSIVRQIINAIKPAADDRVLEIGPGHGALTDHLVHSQCQLDIVEIDRDLASAMHAKHQDNPRVTVHTADILKFDFGTLSTGTRVIGNLPYNISTPLLFLLFQHLGKFVDMTFMLQAEVVDRLVAEAGTGQYGRLGIMCQYHCHTERLFDVPPSAFTPAPRVNSAIVQLRPREISRPVTDLARLEELLVTAFSQRRKTLRNAVRKLLSADDLEALGINPGDRPENVTIDQFVDCANLLASRT